MHLCECGCGLIVQNRFSPGHNRRKYPIVILNHHECKCGCKEMIASNLQYLHGHNQRKAELPRQLCFCGCGELARPGKRYIKGHQCIGKKLSEEHKQKLRRPQSLETKAKQSASLRKTLSDPKVRLRYSEASKKAQGTPEAKQKRSATSKVSWANSSTREHRIAILAEVQNRLDVKLKKSETLSKTLSDPNMREKYSDKAKIACARPEVIKKKKIANEHPDVKLKKSIARKKVWQDPERRKLQLIAIGKGAHIHPNRPELLIKSILDKHWPGFWKYTGDFSFIVNGKNPDFVNEKNKLIIEHYGNYWHEGDDPKDRMEIFAKEGWHTLVIWESELKDIAATACRIKEFCK